jgi:hypothetical protein
VSPKQDQVEDLEAILQSDQKVEYLAKNYDVKKDFKSVSLMVKAYRNLNKEEFDSFVDLDAQYKIEKGADRTSALLVRDYRKAVNKKGVEMYETPASNLNDQQLEAITEQVMEQAQFAEIAVNSRTAVRTTCTGPIRFESSISAQPTSLASSSPSYSPVGFLGQYTHCYGDGPCQSDCDLAYFSYYTSGTPKFIWGSTLRAANVLNWDVNPEMGQVASLGSTYGLQNGAPYIIVAVGLGRVNWEYVGWGTFFEEDIEVEAANRFAADLWIISY